MATNPNRSQPLSGEDAFYAGAPQADTSLGIEGSQGAQPMLRKIARDKALGLAEEEVPAKPFDGLGPILEASDKEAFKITHDLVERQELLSRSRLHQDRHWKNIKLGYTWSSLEKVQDQDIYRQAFPPGSSTLRPSAVPNKAADLCNKLVEVLNTDPPEPSPQATDDDYATERSTELAAQFLKQDGGEAGTDDAGLFWSQTDLATTSSSAFLHTWTDKTGGGWVPTQIKAHPQAQDANNPLVGPDGQPTTDYVLRYITDPDENGQVQFTDNPSQAGRTWLPRIRSDKWGREHVRMFPEDKDLNDCEAVIGLFYCTLGEAKRRWPDVVGEMGEQELAELCDWLPQRYIVLLPPALRSRWRLQTGSQTDPKGSSNDQRMMFYYVHYRRPTTDYPKGMALYVNGAQGGVVLERDTLSADVEVPSEDQQDKLVQNTYLLDIPVTQIRLIQDPEERDPTGKAFMARIGSASEAQATLATAYLEAIDKILHPARFATATSPVESWQVEESRGSGEFVPVLSSDDFPKYEDPPTIPGSFFQMMAWQTEQLNSIASLPKPLQGAEGQQEVSGVARRIAVGQAQLSLSRMSSAYQAAWRRYWRIKLQQAMKYFKTPQLLRFVGEDGAYKQEWFTGVDFSKVTSVELKPGTGTMMPPQEKIQYVSQMVQLQFMTPDEAADAARPTFIKTLGVPADPQQQRIERQISSFLEGPPEGWLQAAKAYDQELQDAQQQQQAQQQAQGGQPQGQPQAPPQTKTPAPWTPFQPLASDDEPPIAALRVRRLRRLLGTVRFSSQDKRWQKVALDEYSRMRKAVADAQGSQAKAQQEAEQAKVQGQMQIKQAELQAQAQAKQAELQATMQAKQAEVQAKVQARQQEGQADLQIKQQELQIQQAIDEQKVALEAQLEQVRLQAEMDRMKLEQEFEILKLRMEQEFELRKLALESRYTMQQQAQQAALQPEPEEPEGEEDDDASGE